MSDVAVSGPINLLIPTEIGRRNLSKSWVSMLKSDLDVFEARNRSPNPHPNQLRNQTLNSQKNLNEPKAVGKVTVT